jgi:hypothetical protein
MLSVVSMLASLIKLWFKTTFGGNTGLLSFNADSTTFQPLNLQSAVFRRPISKYILHYNNKIYVLLTYSLSPSLPIAICKISFGTRISTSFAPAILLKYHSSGMLSLDSYTPCSIYIRRTCVKLHTLNLLFVLIAAPSRYQTSAFCPYLME